jgi:zinc transport system substrate-binding protein
MIMGDRFSKILATFFIGVIVFCFSIETVADESLQVFTANYPLQYFTERIGGDRVDTVMPIPRDEDPAFWTPDIKTIQTIQQCDLIVLNGANYSKWVNKVSLPKSKIVDTSKLFRDRYIHEDQGVTHSHGPEGEHSHGEVAFTIWLDFDFAIQQARAISKVLIRKIPDMKSKIEKNMNELENDLLALDKSIKTIVAKNPTVKLIASHPVYQYFAKRYDIPIRSLHWEPDQTITENDIKILKKHMIDFPAKWVMWEDKPIQSSIDKLQSIGMSSFTFSPCGNVPEKGDFLSVMKANVESLKNAFKK